MAILQLRRNELWSVDAKLKAVARHGLAFARELQVQQTKSTARFLPCGANA